MSAKTMRDQLRDIQKERPRTIVSSVSNEQEFYEFAHRSHDDRLSIADALRSLVRAYARGVIQIPEDMRVCAPSPRRGNAGRD